MKMGSRRMDEALKRAAAGALKSAAFTMSTGKASQANHRKSY
jgi:hypothetical protein